MNPYTQIRLAQRTPEAATLFERLTTWHDEMIAHERQLRAARAASCHEDCPHVEARELWAEALDALGDSARALSFLRSRAMEAGTSGAGAGDNH